MPEITLADITCPISLDIMIEPVMAPDGHNYERYKAKLSTILNIIFFIAKAYFTTINLGHL